MKTLSFRAGVVVFLLALSGVYRAGASGTETIRGTSTSLGHKFETVEKICLGKDNHSIYISVENKDANENGVFDVGVQRVENPVNVAFLLEQTYTETRLEVKNDDACYELLLKKSKSHTGEVSVKYVFSSETQLGTGWICFIVLLACCCCCVLPTFATTSPVVLLLLVAGTALLYTAGAGLLALVCWPLTCLAAARLSRRRQANRVTRSVPMGHGSCHPQHGSCHPQRPRDPFAALGACGDNMAGGKGDTMRQDVEVGVPLADDKMSPLLPARTGVPVGFGRRARDISQDLPRDISQEMVQDIAQDTPRDIPRVIRPREFPPSFRVDVAVADLSDSEDESGAPCAFPPPYNG